jgi:hypothetical protein
MTMTDETAQAIARRVCAVPNARRDPRMERGFDEARRAFLGEPDDYEDGWDIWELSDEEQVHIHSESGSVRVYVRTADGLWSPLDAL